MALSSSYRTLETRQVDTIAYITFARPERRNALTHEMMQELTDVFRTVANDRAVRALVLRGAGGNYCAGGDIGAMAEMPPAPAPGQPDRMVPAYREFGESLLALERLPCAVISIIDGVAVGGGFGMACCSDIVILHRSARFGIPEPKAGFIPSQILPFIVRRLGEGPIRDLAVSGRIIDASEAFQRGLGRVICEDEADVQRALEEALQQVLRMEPQALGVVKRLVQSCALSGDEAVLDDAARSLVELLRRPQARDGMKAFLSKDVPPWAVTGRQRAGQGGGA